MSPSGKSLVNKVAVVTGASSGIGAATGLLLAREGAAVVLAARRTDRLEAIEADIRGLGGAALAVETDVTESKQVERLMERALGEFSRIDILVNNAGVMPLSLVRAVRVEEWDLMIDVNVKGLLYCVAGVLPVMLKQQHGHIVNVGSLAGRRPFPTGTVYSATKFAVRAISAGLRTELSPGDHIRVTDIEPGVVDTELAGHIADPEARNTFAGRWVGKQMLSADDIARAIHYAVSQPEHVNVNEVLIRPTDQDT
jgi:NADP-dependent 3-hydroxy acid dehydrogenase YdfG